MPSSGASKPKHPRVPGPRLPEEPGLGTEKPAPAKPENLPGGSENPNPRPDAPAKEPAISPRL